MSEENLPPIPEQVQVPQEQQTSIVWGVLAVVGSVFCWICGLIFSIIGLCKYRKGSAGRVLSWIGLVLNFLSIVTTAAFVYIVYASTEAAKEAMENMRRDHPEFTEQQLLEYMRDPANKAEIEQYTQESVNAKFGI